MNKCTLIVLVLTLVAASDLGPADDALPSRVTPVVLAARKAGPAVANISTERIVIRRSPGMLPFDDLFNWPDPSPVKQKGLGSGAIVADTGYIVTNAHVVDRASKIWVTLADDKRVEARLVSSDPANDIAVIKINAPAPLPFIEMCTSADLMPGETVVALGNPFGYGHTVTAGVVSATKRDVVVRGRTVYKGLIQTDAAINPGSSGGPLVNVHGQLVGINTAIRAEAQNIGFAIPVDRVREAVLELLDFNVLNHTWLGLDLTETCLPGPPVSRRVQVKAVEPTSPGAKAGLHPGDVLLSLDGHRVRNLIDFRARVLERKAGDTVKMAVRRDGTETVLPVVLSKAPEKPARDLARDRLGLVLQDLTPELAKQLELAVTSGLLVTDVVKDSPGAAVGLRQKDAIVQVEKFRVRGVNELAPILSRLRRGQPLRMAVVRGKLLVWLTVTVH